MSSAKVKKDAWYDMMKYKVWRQEKGEIYRPPTPGEGGV